MRNQGCSSERSESSRHRRPQPGVQGDCTEGRHLATAGQPARASGIFRRASRATDRRTRPMTASGYNLYKKSARDSQYELIERYAPLVKRIAYHLLARLPASVQVEDLIQAGMIGLLEVSTKYDSSKGASFETYAGIRIRGAMLDEVRKGDWAPRSVHRNTRMVSDAIRSIEAKTGRDAKDHEVADEL